MDKRNSDSPDDAIDSPSFQKAHRKAEEYVKDPEKLETLVSQAQEKSQTIDRTALTEVWDYLMTMFRLVQAFYSKDYRKIPWQSLVMIVAALIYFVSPFDFIPDFIPILGFVDDAAVLGFLIKALKGDLDTFIEWEQQHSDPQLHPKPKPPSDI